LCIHDCPHWSPDAAASNRLETADTFTDIYSDKVLLQTLTDIGK